MAQLVHFLERTISGTPADQQTTLQFLQEAARDRYPEFISQLSIVLASADVSPYARQAAGLQLKNLLVAKDIETAASNQRRWTECSDQVRSAVKENVLRTLGTETVRPSIAAQCINAIAGIELPFGSWREVIDILKTNITTANGPEKLVESSLEALGYICQDVQPQVIEVKANDILTAIIHGMRSDQPHISVRQAATEALLNALELTKNNFANQDERNIIMRVVCEATQAPDKKVRVTALQCLVKIVSLYYQYMDAYMRDALFAITVDAMKSPENEVILQGIEFWSNICEEELMLTIKEQEAREEGKAPTVVSRYYARGAVSHIMPILLKTLATQEDNDDEDEWVPAKAAGVCIMLLAQCTNDEIVPLVLPFVQEHFGSADWHYREAAIMAFGSILDGPSPNVLDTLVNSALMPLISTLGDAHLSVRDTSAWAIGRVCDTCENLVTKPEVLQSLVPALFNALSQEPRVAFNACWALSSLVKAAYQIARDQGTDESGEPETYVLSPVFMDMVKKLIETTDRPDANEHNLRISGYEALMELIKNSPKDCYCHVQQTTVDVLHRLERLLTIENQLVTSSDRSQLRDVQSLLCATLQSVLRKIHKEDAVLISDPVMIALLHILNRCATGKDAGGVMEDALMAVSTLIEVMGEGFGQYMDQFKPHLVAALRSHDEHLVCQAAIGVVSDLCHAFGPKIAPLMDEFVQLLLEILQDTNVKHAVKPYALGCFSDIAIALGPGYFRYLEITVKYLMNAVIAAQITNEDDYEQVDYVESLRENCVSGFTGIVQAMRNTPEGMQQLHPYIPEMVKLITMVAESGNLSSDSLQGSTCGLIGDLMGVLGKDILPLLNSDAINGLLQRCRRSKNNKAKSLGVWASRELSHLKRQANIN
uniref:Importin N-terminal domain-containing protein n=1 Tax=Panagrolaimus sp. JU765 TaxID=591449 RepID=A0AC34RF88_9BILA